MTNARGCSLLFETARAYPGRAAPRLERQRASPSSSLWAVCRVRAGGRADGSQEPAAELDGVGLTQGLEPTKSLWLCAARQVSSTAWLGDLYKPGEEHEDLLAGCPGFPNSGLPGEEWWPAKDWPDVILPLSNTWEEGLRNECPSSVPGTTPQIFPSSLSSDSSVSRWGAWTRWLVHSMGSSAG